MKEFENVSPLKAVYCYYFPEVRPLVSAVYSGNSSLTDIYLTQTDKNKAQKIIDGLHFKKEFDVPKTANGKVDLDMLHEPIIDAIVDEYKESVNGLSDYKYRYFTSGSSEGIFHYLTLLKSKGENPIYTFSGEYEGYKEYGKTMGLFIEEVGEESIFSKKGNWIISNPSAINGNIIDNNLINELASSGNKLAIDLAYVGSTDSHKFDISNSNIETVFLSLSKPFGLFRYRLGFTFSREPIDSLYANKWFKSIPNLLLSLKVIQDLGLKTLPERYKPVQKQIIKEINSNTGLNMTVSDALLLGNIKNSETQDFSIDQRQLIEDFKRGENFRFCLTPYFERKEKHE